MSASRASIRQQLTLPPVLTGVLVIGWGNKLWRNTGGRLTEKAWLYPIGGQY